MSKPVKAVGKAVGSVFKAVGKAVTGVVKAVGKVVGAVVNFVASPFMGLFGKPGLPNDAQEAERQSGVLIQTQGSNVNIPVVYGYRKVAGTVVYVETGATKNKYLYVAYVFSEAQAAGIRRIFIDDIEIDGAAARLNTGFPLAVTTGKFKDRVVLQSWGGRPRFGNEYTDDGDASILREAPSWKRTHTFNGLVTVFARYEWVEAKTQEEADNNPFGGSIPTIQIELLGRTVASLVTTDSESRTYGAFNQGYTERYSTNPAEILLDYLRNPDYGKGLSNSEIDWPSFRTAAAKYNQIVEYVPGKSGPFLTMNYVLDTTQTVFSNVKALLANMRAYLPYVDGKYKLIVEDAGNPTDVTSGQATIVRNFTKDNLTGSIVYTGIEKSAKYNTVVVQYVDPDDKWSVQEAVFPGTESARQQLIAADGGRENRYQVTMGGITNWVMAYFMARTILLKSRFQDSCTITAMSEAFDLEPGDNVYINGNILRFGDETQSSDPWPWRIVSKTLNDDYTFELGCVRNPDFIYPFVRPSPRDIVLPPFIPKNAEIAYPGPGRVYDIGLIPPVNGIRDPNYTFDPTGIIVGTPPGYPVPGTPTGPDGGGVGGPGSPINANPINNVPPPAVRIPPLEDRIRIDRAEFTLEGNSVFATLTFLQPGHPMYAGVDIYYKRNISTERVWLRVDANAIPGEGQPIAVKIGPLIKGQPYVVNTNVRYSNGENSTFIGTAVLNNVGGELVTDPTDFATKVGEGWTLPTDEPPVRRDTYLNRIVGKPLLTNGQPRDPREMQWTITQEINQIPVNNNVAGINIYWKPTSATFWNKNPVQFPANYSPGFPYTFKLPFTLGQATSAQDYNFVVRFFYKDGLEATVQFRTTIRVETNGFAQFDFDPFYGAVVVRNEDISSFRVITVDEAPLGAVPDPRDLQISFNRTVQLVNVRQDSILLAINEPVDPNRIWAGVRLYFRPVLSGQNPKYEITNFVPVPKDVVGRFIRQNIVYDQVYEYVIVPLVFVNGVRTETRRAWYATGALHNRLENGRVPDFYERFNFQLLDTDVALNRIKTVFPQDDPTVQVQGWDLTRIVTSTGAVSTYYQLRFYHQHIDGYQSIDVYRRTASSGNRTGTSPYKMLGRWEKLNITTVNNSPLGVVTVNLRSSTDFYEFRSDSPDPTLEPFYSSKSKVPLNFATISDQFLIVAKFNGQDSTKGTLLQGIQYVGPTSGGTVNGLVGRPPPSIVEVEDYNTFPAGPLRNLNEARNRLQNNELWVGFTQFNNGTHYVPPSVTPAIL